MEPIIRRGERKISGVEYKEKRKSSVTNMVDDAGRENRQTKSYTHDIRPRFNGNSSTNIVHQARVEGWPRENKFLETANADTGIYPTGDRPKQVAMGAV